TGTGSSATTHVVLSSNGQWTDLGLPSGYTGGVVDGLDHAGEVLVTVFNAGNPTSTHLFLYSNGQWTDINSLLPAGTTVTLDGAPLQGINDAGQIIALDTRGHSYLLTPGQGTPPTSVPTSTTLTVSAANVATGQSVTMTATVASTSSNAGTPSGTVTFLD